MIMWQIWKEKEKNENIDENDGNVQKCGFILEKMNTNVENF